MWTRYIQDSKLLQVLIINQYGRKLLACKNGYEIPIWSWNYSYIYIKLFLKSTYIHGGDWTYGLCIRFNNEISTLNDTVKDNKTPTQYQCKGVIKLLTKREFLFDGTLGTCQILFKDLKNILSLNIFTIECI